MNVQWAQVLQGSEARRRPDSLPEVNRTVTLLSLQMRNAGLLLSLLTPFSSLCIIQEKMILSSDRSVEMLHCIFPDGLLIDCPSSNSKPYHLRNKSS